MRRLSHQERALTSRLPEQAAAGQRDPLVEQLPELVQLLHDVAQNALHEARSIGAHDTGIITRVQTMLDGGATRRDSS